MNTKQVIVMRKDLNMRKGKMCAQASHASLGIFTDMMTKKFMGNSSKVPLKDFKLISYKIDVENQPAIVHWLENSFRKIVVGIDSEEELILLYKKAKSLRLPCVLIEDSGLTEFNGIPTNTCIAIGPAEEADIDKITNKLKLL
jgi:PTH2 family peptidyl-tRNA hydrolase